MQEKPYKAGNTKTNLKNNQTIKSLNRNKGSNSCSSCNVCNRLRNPHSSSENISSALSYAKAVGKESCAVSFMQRHYGSRFTASVLSPTIQKKCSCGGSCSKCKGEEDAEKISMNIMRMPSRQHTLLIQRECRYFAEGWIHPRTESPSPGGTWCETLEEARERAAACPSDCFVYSDGPTSHPYRSIPGWPCAHYVAHEIGIRTGDRHARCLEGYSVTIGQIIQGRTAYALADARVNDVYIYPGGGHSGIVRQVDTRRNRILVEACGIGGGTYSDWRMDGTVYR